MGKLFIGRFGRPPDAESASITLKDCYQRINLKPSDFVSEEPPSFFKKAHGAAGKYLVFQVDAEEIGDAVVWRPGYYLLPLEAADVLKVFNKKELVREGALRRPLDMDCKETPPTDVMERATLWADASQPLFFQCHCPTLILRLDPPWGFRRHWMGRLSCHKRCCPALKTRL